MIQRLLHKLKALQMRILLGKVAKALLTQQTPQHPAHPLADARVALQLRQMHVNDLVD
ncbi:hypothetical protein D3C72_2125410 [compost metagenome]